MADMVTVIIQGTIPYFDNGVASGNLDNEEKAWCRVNLQVETAEKQDNGYYKTRTIEVRAFKKTAQILARCSKGTGVLLECDIASSRPRMNNGEAVLNDEGKKVYDPQYIVVRRVHFQRTAPKDKNTANSGKSTNVVEDPMAYDFGASTTAPTQNIPDSEFDFAF